MPAFYYTPLLLSEGKFWLFYSEKGLRELVFPGENCRLLTENAVKKENPLSLALKAGLADYFKGKAVSFCEFPIDLSWATPFSQKAWQETARIPWGKTLNYGELAEKLGNPKSCRAVGRALGKNQLPIIIPCHRVLGKGGELVGFSSGLDWKAKLLRLEGVLSLPVKKEAKCIKLQ